MRFIVFIIGCYQNQVMLMMQERTRNVLVGINFVGLVCELFNGHFETAT